MPFRLCSRACDALSRRPTRLLLLLLLLSAAAAAAGGDASNTSGSTAAVPSGTSQPLPLPFKLWTQSVRSSGNRCKFIISPLC